MSKLQKVKNYFLQHLKQNCSNFSFKKMKLMDLASLNSLTHLINELDIGESTLYGRIEAYSCILNIK